MAPTDKRPACGAISLWEQAAASYLSEAFVLHVDEAGIEISDDDLHSHVHRESLKLAMLLRGAVLSYWATEASAIPDFGSG